jgi:predicted nucleic acid-binding protein
LDGVGRQSEGLAQGYVHARRVFAAMKGIADTGFLVAFLNARDEHHDWAVELADRVTTPLITCEAVLTEAAYLLGNAALVLEVLSSGLLTLDFDLDANREHLVDLAGRFSDQAPDLCDLCVVRMSELHSEYPVLTTDRKDFSVYRRNRKQIIPTIFPPER